MQLGSTAPDISALLSRALQQSEHRRRQAIPESVLREPQRASMIGGFFQYLLASIPRSYSVDRILFAVIDEDDILCYEQPFDMAASPRLALSSRQRVTEPRGVSFAGFDTRIAAKQLWGELSTLARRSEGYLRLPSLGGAGSVRALEELRSVICSEPDREVELLVVDLTGMVFTGERSSAERVVERALAGYMMLSWVVNKSAPDLRREEALDLNAKTRRAHVQFLQAVKIALSSDRVQIAVEAVSRRLSDEEARLECTVAGAKIALHRFGYLLGAAKSLVDAFPDASAVAGRENFYLQFVQHLREGYESVQGLKRHVESPPERRVEFATASTLLGRLQAVYDDRPREQDKHKRTMLDVRVEQQLLSRRVVVPSPAVLDELFALQLDNALGAVAADHDAEKLIRVELVDGEDYLDVAISNFAAKIAPDMLTSLQTGRAVRGSRGFGWGTLLSRQVLGRIGGRIYIDSPIAGDLGTRVTMGFRKVDSTP